MHHELNIHDRLQSSQPFQEAKWRLDLQLGITKCNEDNFKAYHITGAQFILVLRMPPTYSTLSSLDVISTVQAQCPVYCEHTARTKMGKLAPRLKKHVNSDHKF